MVKMVDGWPVPEEADHERLAQLLSADMRAHCDYGEATGKAVALWAESVVTHAFAAMLLNVPVERAYVEEMVNRAWQRAFRSAHENALRNLKTEGNA